MKRNIFNLIWQIKKLKVPKSYLNYKRTSGEIIIPDITVVHCCTYLIFDKEPEDIQWVNRKHLQQVVLA